ncbi:MAG: DUF3450 domain-containing protein, partial [Pseudomonadota bacterium]
DASGQSQKRIEKISDEARIAVEGHLQALRSARITEAYNSQLSRLIESQQAEIVDLQKQIDSVEETEQVVLPMMSIMVEQLSDFVGQDLPFLSRERESRIEKLELLLDRADVTVAEKYRQILEAYLIEVGYGRTIEAYSDDLLTDPNSTRVNYLRIGRLALYYQSLSGDQSGLWLPQQSGWQPLNDNQNQVLARAIEIARQQRVPELLALPVPAPKQ